MDRHLVATCKTINSTDFNKNTIYDLLFYIFLYGQTLKRRNRNGSPARVSPKFWIKPNFLGVLQKTVYDL